MKLDLKITILDICDCNLWLSEWVEGTLYTYNYIDLVLGTYVKLARVKFYREQAQRATDTDQLLNSSDPPPHPITEPPPTQQQSTVYRMLHAATSLFQIPINNKGDGLNK